MMQPPKAAKTRKTLRAAIALFLPVLALIVQLPLWPRIPPLYWLFFYPAVFFSSWLGGVIPGLLACLMSVAFVWYFLVPPTLVAFKSNPDFILPCAVFLGMGFLFVAAHSLLRRANRKTRQALATSQNAFQETTQVRARLEDELRMRERRESQFRFLSEASRLLAEVRDYESMLQKSAQLTVPSIADGCLLHILETDGSLRLRAVSYRNPNDQSVLNKLRNLISEKGLNSREFANVLKTAKPIEGFDLPAALCDQDTECHILAKMLPIKSYIIIPLLERGIALGTITLLSEKSSQPFESLDVLFFEALARRIAAVIENAKLLQDAQQATKVREEVLAIVSHDLKNPLSAIQLAALLLPKIDKTADQTIAKLSTRILNSALQMDRLLSDLLDVEKMQSGTFGVEIHPGDVRRTIQIAAEQLRPQAEQKDVMIQVEIPDHLPLVDCDYHRVIQALSNLISNAVKFTSAGGLVSISAGPAPEFGVIISVSDTGPGITADHIPKIFDRFWQAKYSKGLGSGLGLYITKGIVEAHHGRIWVESTLHTGSTFHVFLPATKAQWKATVA